MKNSPLLRLCNSNPSFTPAALSGLQVWLDTSQPNSLYQDTGKTTPATTNAQSVAAWADKSGNGVDALLYSTYTAPVLADGGGGSKSIYFDNTSNTRSLTLGNPAAINFANGGPFTIFVVHNPTVDSKLFLARNNAGSVCLTTGYTNAGSMDIFSSAWVAADPYVKNQDNLLVYQVGPVVGSPFAISGADTYGLITFYTSNFPYGRRDGIPGGSSSAYNWYIASWSSNGLWQSGHYKAIIIYNRILTETEVLKVNAYLASKFSTLTIASPPSDTLLAYTGDSITWGTTAKPYPLLVYRSQATPTKYRFHDFGVGGWTVYQVATHATTYVDPLYSASRANNILSVFAGTNDLYNSGHSAATIYSDLLAYWAARRAAGWKVIAWTVLPRGSDAGLEAIRITLNTSIRSDATKYDALVDAGADATMGLPGSQNNTTYYNADKTHPTDAGYAILAGLAKTQIDTVIGVTS